jgi:hypothetical protein
MKEIFEVLEARIKSPVLGYFALTFMAINWQPLFYLIVESKGAIDRIEYFVANTDWKSLILYPAITSSLIAIIYPWINYIFLYLCIKPTEMKNALQAQSEHTLLIKKKQLEELRSEMLSSAERKLIERAQRDQELESIENEEVKEQLKAEIEQLRSGQSTEIIPNKASPDYENFKQLMEMASVYRQHANESKSYGDQNDLKEQAKKLEARAHALLM